MPVRLLGGLHYLVLEGRATGWAWPDVRETLDREREWLARFVDEQPVQTNEVQRCWALLPAFLSLGEQPLDLVELGASAGLNLLWDRYRYEYARGAWGPETGLELRGEERRPVPGALLERRAEVRRRRGIDLRPVDVRDPGAARLLECFVWPDQAARLERLENALALARRDPPELIRGDYVELLPSLLAERDDPHVLTVVFQTVSTVYLEADRYEELRRIVFAAEPPVAWISTRRFPEETTGVEGGFELELRPPESGEARLVATLGYHGQWLDWLAP